MARRIEVVIDSSVAVKWFSEEEATPSAVQLRDSHVKGHVMLISTPLLACELANALRYKPDYNKDRLSEAMEYFYKLHLYESPIDAHLLSRSSEIAFRGNVTVYDAIPVALAVLRKIKCITADKDTQYAKLKTKGYPIEILSDRLESYPSSQEITSHWPKVRASTAGTIRRMRDERRKRIS